MNAPLVNIGPGIEQRPRVNLVEPVAIRALGGLNHYNAGTDEEINPPEPIFRIDVLVKTGSGFNQRSIDLMCERRVPPDGGRIGKDLWLYEPRFGQDSMRAISMLVDKTELIAKLRAMADEIEKL